MILLTVIRRLIPKWVTKPFILSTIDATIGLEATKPSMADGTMVPDGCESGYNRVVGMIVQFITL